MSAYWILKRYSPPLTETQVVEAAAEIEREIVNPLKTEVDVLKAFKVEASKPPKPKHKSQSHLATG